MFAIVAGLALDIYMGLGFVAFLRASFSVTTVFAFALFLIVVLAGMMTGHRAFLHSITALAASGAALYYIFPLFGVAYMAGFASHIVLDLFNQSSVQILAPIPWKPCLGLCDSDDRHVNHRIELAASMTIIILVAAVVMANIPNWVQMLFELVAGNG